MHRRLDETGIGRMITFEERLRLAGRAYAEGRIDPAFLAWPQPGRARAGLRSDRVRSGHYDAWASVLPT